jgi:acyl-CoA synthetase (AMP-forming)/AMP-acid ligase II
MSDLIHDFLFTSAHRTPAAPALVYGQLRLDYATLADTVRRAAHALLDAGLGRGERVAVCLEKRIENVPRCSAPRWRAACSCRSIHC